VYPISAVPTAVLFSSLGTVINIETNCNTALLIVVLSFGGGGVEFDSKRKGRRRGWRNLHKDEPDNLYIWRNRIGLMK